MLNFEKYLTDFNSTIDIGSFLLNMVLIAVLTYGIKVFYIKYGRAISDRSKFSNNFIPLAIGTLLIITVIKSSIALSLGLVGALSIVRFRAAIKDPEELTMLFIVIGFGLMGGANKPLLALVSFIIILPLFYFNNKLASEKIISKNKTFLNINSSLTNIEKITKVISEDLEYVELRRTDISKDGIFASYLCKIDQTSQIEKIKNSLIEIDSDIRISMIDQPEVLS